MSTAGITEHSEPAAPPVTVYAENASVTYLIRTGRLRRPVEVAALKNLSLVLREGTSLGVLGLNGAGKSTLVKAIAGTVALSSGQLLVRSQPKRVSVGSTLRAELTGRQNITLGLYALGLNPEEAEALVPAVVEYSELAEFIELPLDTYSAGMKARLKFSISTQVQPDILLLDEALAVGDRAFKEKSLHRVNEIKATAGTVVLVSHSMKEISETCDLALWLDKGEPRLFGPTEEVVEAYEEHIPS